MTSQQNEMITKLSNELNKRGKNAAIGWKESTNYESYGSLFGEVEGVTITVSPKGLINIPSVRTYHPPKYPTPVAAAVDAGELWERQKSRDDADLGKAKERTTGHLGPIVGPDLKCRNQDCPCNLESVEQRQRRAQGGFNTNPFRCS